MTRLVTQLPQRQMVPPPHLCCQFLLNHRGWRGRRLCSDLPTSSASRCPGQGQVQEDGRSAASPPSTSGANGTFPHPQSHRASPVRLCPEGPRRSRLHLPRCREPRIKGLRTAQSRAGETVGLGGRLCTGTGARRAKCCRRHSLSLGPGMRSRQDATLSLRGGRATAQNRGGEAADPPRCPPWAVGPAESHSRRTSPHAN